MGKKAFSDVCVGWKTAVFSLSPGPRVLSERWFVKGRGEGGLTNPPLVGQKTQHKAAKFFQGLLEKCPKSRLQVTFYNKLTIQMTKFKFADTKPQGREIFLEIRTPPLQV